MKKVLFIVLMLVVVLASKVAMAEDYLGNLSVNPFGSNSLSNPALNPLLNNPYSPYTNPYSNRSMNNPFATRAPRLHTPRGQYRGRLSVNPFAPDSISNPFGRYGNSLSPDSINNPLGAGSSFRPSSPNNLFGNGWMIIGE